MESSKTPKAAAPALPGQVPTPAPAPAPAGGIKVRAVRTGYYGLARRREGDVFTIEAETQFSPKWMEKVDAATPEVRSTAQDLINRQHDARLVAKISGGVNPTGQADPLGGGLLPEE